MLRQRVFEQLSAAQIDTVRILHLTESRSVYMVTGQDSSSDLCKWCLACLCVIKHSSFDMIFDEKIKKQIVL